MKRLRAVARRLHVASRAVADGLRYNFVASPS